MPPKLTEEEMQQALALAAELIRATDELKIAMYRTDNGFMLGYLTVAAQIILNRRSNR
jgi:hypothetical protein